MGTGSDNLPRILVQLARMDAGQPLRLTSDDIRNVLAARNPVQAQRSIARLDDKAPLPQHQLAFHRPPGASVGAPPALVYGAAHDHLVPHGDADRTAAYTGTAVRMLPGTGHYVVLDAAGEQVLDAVLADPTSRPRAR